MLHRVRVRFLIRRGVAPNYTADSAVPILDRGRNVIDHVCRPCVDTGQMIHQSPY